MFRFSTAKKGWLDHAGGTNDTNRSIMSGASMSPTTENMTIALKLKERLKQARDNIAAKKLTNPESMMTEQTHIIEPTMVVKDKSFNESDDENLKINLNVNREEGFTERFDDQNELQRRARNTMAMLKKSQKKREPATRNTQAPQNIPILSYHYQSGPGMAIPSANLRHHAIFDMSQEAKKVINEEKYNMKIDDPNSVLHIANYHQNKDFDQYAKVIIEDNKQFLKINAPDVFTFFRLHHELHEMNRKKTRFLDMKTKFFDNKDPEEVIQYDENLDNFDAINSGKGYSSTGKKKEMMDKKEYQYAEDLAKKLKETGKKKDLKTLEKNFAYGLMGGIKESKAKMEGKF